jgi:uncharacterized protein (DUF362 family)
MTASRVFVDRFDPASPDGHEAATTRALQHIGIERFLSADTRVFIKPNFTYPFYKKGVTTSPRAIEAVVSHIRQWTRRITIVESDGGAHAWRAEEAFAGHGIPEMCAKYGISASGLTALPREVASTEIAGREVSIALASVMLHESDLFITMPVPKVHVMTGVSLAFKNQWGCIPDVKRLRNHPDLPYKLLAVNKLLRTRAVVFDGTWFLDRTGPMDGDPVAMNLVVAADDPGAGSLACCRIMGIDPRTVEHKRLAMKAGMMPSSFEGIELNTPLEPFATHRFTLQRTKLNYVTLAAFHSNFLTWFIYDSVFAKPVHELLYLIRGRPKDMAPYW